MFVLANLLYYCYGFFLEYYLFEWLKNKKTEFLIIF